MKAICITQSWRRGGRNIWNAPSFSEEVTVIGETDDGVGYELAEYPHDQFPTFGWHKAGFIPLSSIDESIMERDYNKEKVTP